MEEIMAWLPLRECNLFFFDCETGGLEPALSDMVEVGVVVTDPTGRTVIDEYSAKVFPKKPVDAQAAAVNGYNAEQWAAEAVELDHAMVKMLSMARNAIFVAHNTPFDWGFFNLAMGKRMQKWPGPYQKIDTIALSMPLLMAGRVESLKLEVLAPYFGIVNTKAHSALGDVRACRELYLKLMELYSPLFAKPVEVAASDAVSIG